jgi:hypothetical protein
MSNDLRTFFLNYTGRYRCVFLKHAFRKNSSYFHQQMAPKTGGGGQSRCDVSRQNPAAGRILLRLREGVGGHGQRTRIDHLQAYEISREFHEISREARLLYNLASEPWTSVADSRMRSSATSHPASQLAFLVADRSLPGPQPEGIGSGSQLPW